MTAAHIYRCDEPGCEVWGFPSDGLVLSYTAKTHYCTGHFPRDQYDKCARCNRFVRPYNANVRDHPGTLAKAKSNPVMCTTCVTSLRTTSVPDYTPEQITAMRRLTRDPVVLYALGIPTDEEAS